MESTAGKTDMYCCDDTSMIRDDHFGMVPRKNFTKTHVKTINSALIYQTTYGARTSRGGAVSA